jgi:hypothetical protein
MADEMAQLAPTADSTSGPSTELGPSKADTQVRTIIVPTDLEQIFSSYFSHDTFLT